MAAPRKIYDFLIEPLRVMDQREGDGFLERWFTGPQAIWEQLLSSILTVPQLWSITECPDRFLEYLKWIVGWTSSLDYITRSLTAEELRRLISVSIYLWRERGTESSILEVLFFATAARCRIWNWFDFRWIVGETGMGEERDGRGDPWIIPEPSTEEYGPDAYRPEYLSNLRIVDDGTLNRTLVVNLMKLMRASGERWGITYLSFLDLFTNPTDSTQWDISSGGTVSVADGHLAFGASGVSRSVVNIRDLNLLQGSFTARAKMVSDDLSDSASFMIILIDSIAVERYAAVFYADGVDMPTVSLFWDSGFGLLLVESAYIPEITLWRNVYYSFRLTVTDEEDGRVRLQIFIDGNECINRADSQFMTGPYPVFTYVKLQSNDAPVEVDEVEILGLPIESDEINIS